MKQLKILVLVLFATMSVATAQEKTNENKAQDLQYELEKLKINYENQKDIISILEKNIDEKILVIKNNTQSEIDHLDTKYRYYFAFGSILIAFVGFLINFFGRQLIKERVEKLIQKTAMRYAQNVTHEVINRYIADGKIETAIEQHGQPAIEKIIKKLEREGFMAIDGIKSKGNEAISSMLASHKVSKNEIDSVSDEEIIKNNQSSRASEYFELALSSKNAIVQVSLYEKVLEIEPNNIEAWNNLGVSYNIAYNYQKAIKVLNKCIKINPHYALPFANLANSYNMLNELDVALGYANEAVKLDPGLDYTYSVKGHILTKKGHLKEAEKTFNKAIALNPKSPEAFFTRGYFYEETDQFDKSEMDYFKADTLGFPNRAMLYNNLAVLHRRKKDYQTAITFLNKAKKIDPSFPNIDGTLALIYADKKDGDNFYKHLVIALDKGCPVWNYLSDPGFDDYRNDVKFIELIELYKTKYTA